MVQRPRCGTERAPAANSHTPILHFFSLCAVSMSWFSSPPPPPRTSKVVDEERLVFRLAWPGGEQLLQAPSKAILSSVLAHLDRRLGEFQALPAPVRAHMRRAAYRNPFAVLSAASAEGRAAEGGRGFSESVGQADNFADDEDVENLLAWPEDALAVAAHVALLPLKVRPLVALFPRCPPLPPWE